MDPPAITAPQAEDHDEAERVRARPARGGTLAPHEPGAPGDAQRARQAPE